MRVSSCWSSWILIGSFLSLEPLLGSFRSIYSISSLSKYLSKSLPNFSDSYTKKLVMLSQYYYIMAEMNLGEQFTYILQISGSSWKGFLCEIAANDEFDLPHNCLGVVETGAKFELGWIQLIHKSEWGNVICFEDLVCDWVAARTAKGWRVQQIGLWIYGCHLLRRCLDRLGLIDLLVVLSLHCWSFSWFCVDLK